LQEIAEIAARAFHQQHVLNNSCFSCKEEALGNDNMTIDKLCEIFLQSLQSPRVIKVKSGPVNTTRDANELVGFKAPLFPTKSDDLRKQ